jgi:hypothetical protein
MDMSAKQPIRERARSLEDQFFAKQEKELVEAIRQRSAKSTHQQAISEASGVLDETVIAELVRLKLTAETLTAFRLVPLVEIAWADQRLDEKEKRAILEAASQAGIEPGFPAYGLLEVWLAAPPGDALMEAWKSVVESLRATLTYDAVLEMRNQVLGGARKVAEASGGILGLGQKISDAEQAMLDELGAAFE